ncbi:dTDP-4-dehydrorhamnose reductase [Thermoflavifilum aggregans]|uniref:dTDP-4-dehydrorhamnose reductase n=1 Tax=Thermoflavifilum aggregans TaxID=454188 RepID=A0A2M9CVH6_9BACT|nr:SDR family oxidoreductase [Thermoflavifilum aggregans]PJJ75893.1 dTDP-4-dehydrorhamnose reductase [Thermoflavifilum aggregans]
MRILLTGANGLLGQHMLTHVAPDTPHEWIATGKGTCRFPCREGIVYESLDITDAEAVKALWARYRPEAVIHAAAMTHVDACEQQKDACWKTNVEGTYHLLQAARTTQSFFLFLSTDFIFNGEAGPYAENDLPDPVNYYGLSKLCAEQLVRCAGIPWAIARTVLVYGNVAGREKSNIVRWIVQQLQQGHVVSMVNDQWRTPTWAADLASGCWQILSRRAQGVFHLSGPDMLTPYQMAMEIAKVWNLPADLVQPTDSHTFRQPARRPSRTGLIIRKAVQQLAYQPHTFAESLHIIRKQLIQT